MNLIKSIIKKLIKSLGLYFKTVHKYLVSIGSYFFYYFNIFLKSKYFYYGFFLLYFKKINNYRFKYIFYIFRCDYIYKKYIFKISIFCVFKLKFFQKCLKFFKKVFFKFLKFYKKVLKKLKKKVSNIIVLFFQLLLKRAETAKGLVSEMKIYLRTTFNKLQKKKKPFKLPKKGRWKRKRVIRKTYTIPKTDTDNPNAGFKLGVSRRLFDYPEYIYWGKKIKEWQKIHDDMYNEDEFYYYDEEWLEYSLVPVPIYEYTYHIEYWDIFNDVFFTYLISAIANIPKVVIPEPQYKTERVSIEGKRRVYKKKRHYLTIHMYAKSRRLGITVVHLFHCRAKDKSELRLFYNLLKYASSHFKKKDDLKISFKKVYLYQNRFHRSFKNSNLWEYSSDFLSLFRLPNTSRGEMSVLEDVYNLEEYCIICDAMRRWNNPFHDCCFDWKTVSCDVYRCVTSYKPNKKNKSTTSFSKFVLKNNLEVRKEKKLNSYVKQK